MNSQDLLRLFVQFGLAGLTGFLLGLEREMSSRAASHLGLRDFVLFSLLGAICAFIADQYGNAWIIVAGLGVVMVFLASQYWADRAQDPGITTEIAALLTFTLGVLFIRRATELAIALAIVTSAVLFERQLLQSLRDRIQMFELQAVLRFLVITFIILPVLPRQSLDTYMTFPVGTVAAVDVNNDQVQVKLAHGGEIRHGELLHIYDQNHDEIGTVEIVDVYYGGASGLYHGELLDHVAQGAEVRAELEIPVLNTAFAALKPYSIWLIVVLVSFISFVGYVLIKLIGSNAGIGLTGLVGGLVSSTVTTLSFARRSLENPGLNPNFAVAVVLAASIMFPRLLVEIAVVNRDLMHSMAVPVLTMGITGLAVAAFFYRRSKTSRSPVQTMQFDNPFSLKSAISFGLVFAAILMVTRLATTYLGNRWLPLVAVVSGLTDADAIAFSLSDAQQAGTISLEWASFNLVLGALSNTFMKLILVFTLGDRGLFRHLLAAFLIIGAVGIVAMTIYYHIDLLG